MFTDIEAALAQRCRLLVPEVGERTPSLGDLLQAEKLPALPAIAIAYDGYVPVASAGVDNKISSTWLLAAAVSTARQRDGAREVRSQALAIAGKLLAGLVGWKPGKGYSRFVAAPPGGPVWVKDRQLYLLPVAVATSHVISGVDEDDA